VNPPENGAIHEFIVFCIPANSNRRLAHSLGLRQIEREKVGLIITPLFPFELHLTLFGGQLQLPLAANVQKPDEIAL